MRPRRTRQPQRTTPLTPRPVARLFPPQGLLVQQFPLVRQSTRLLLGRVALAGRSELTSDAPFRPDSLIFGNLNSDKAVSRQYLQKTHIRAWPHTEVRRPLLKGAHEHSRRTKAEPPAAVPPACTLEWSSVPERHQKRVTVTRRPPSCLPKAHAIPTRVRSGIVSVLRCRPSSRPPRVSGLSGYTATWDAPGPWDAVSSPRFARDPWGL